MKYGLLEIFDEIYAFRNNSQEIPAFKFLGTVLKNNKMEFSIKAGGVGP